MKTFLVLILICIAGSSLPAQMTYVPDDKFEQALIDLGYDTPPLNDSVPTKNIDTVTSLYFPGKKISDFTGIEDFSALLSFFCFHNELSNLDISKNLALTFLNCSDNQITNLNVSENTALTGLACSDNFLTSLDVSKNTALTFLDCDGNKLTSLDVSKNTDLSILRCSRNLLTYLDVSKNSSLTELLCWENQLTSLDVSKNTPLYWLFCWENQLTSLDVSKNTALYWLYCNSNNLESLDVSKNATLRELICSKNQLTSLDISKNTALILLYCSDNDLTNLDVSGSSLMEELSCNNNPHLYCIQVADSAKIANKSLWKKDSHAVWSEDCSLVSVEEEANPGNDITISPNPAGDYVEISGVVGEVMVYDVLGVEVFTSFLRKQESHGSNEIPNQVGNDSHVIRINISQLSPGVYFVRIGSYFAKFVKI